MTALFKSRHEPSSWFAAWPLAFFNKKSAGPPRFELGTSVLETDVLPLKLQALKRILYSQKEPIAKPHHKSNAGTLYTDFFGNLSVFQRSKTRCLPLQGNSRFSDTLPQLV